MRTILTRGLLFICAVTAWGNAQNRSLQVHVTQRSADAALVSTSQNDAPLSSTRKGQNLILQYRVAETPTVNAGEWPALVMFLSPANGQILDERVVSAKDRRPNISAEMIITAPVSLWFTQVSNPKDAGLAGYRVDIYDTTAVLVKSNAVLEVSFDSLKTLNPSINFGSTAPPTFDVAWLGSEFNVSAALVAFKTQDKNFVFQRFLGPIHTITVKMSA